MAEAQILPSERSEAIRSALGRLCALPHFAKAPALTQMLRYIVETTLAGDQENIKAYSIATQALGRPTSFDPQSDPIVRVTATRLRRALEAYGQGPGRDDDVLIRIEPGSYVPLFIWRSADVADEPKLPQTVSEPAPILPPSQVGARDWFGGHARLTMTLFAVAAAIFTGVLAWRAARAPGIGADQASSPFNTDGRPTLIVGRLDLLANEPDADAMRKAVRSRIISELRAFDDILILKDDPDYTRSRDRANSDQASYHVEGVMTLTPEKLLLTSNTIHLATNVVIDSGVFERPRGAMDVAQTAEAVRIFASRLAQPYGAISTHAWTLLAKSPEHQNVYICQLRVFQYWQKSSRAAFDETRECVEKSLAENPESAAMRANLAFLQVEAVRAHYLFGDDDLVARKQLLDEALSNANRAVQIAPASARAHSALGAAYMINRAFPAAVASAREAVRLNRVDPELQADLGAKLVQVGEYREGYDLLRAVIGQGGSQPPWRLIFASLAAYMLDEKVELARLASTLKKDESVLSIAIQLIAAASRGDDLGSQALRRVLGSRAPRGPEQVIGIVGDRIYNEAILERMYSDLLSIYVN